MQTYVKKNTSDIRQMMTFSKQDRLSLSSGSFDFAKYSEVVTSIVIMHNFPFKAVEWEGVRITFHYLHNDV